MVDDNELDLLRDGPVPTPRDAARERALDAALSAYDLQNTSAAPQGTASGRRLTERAWRLWSEMMNKKMYRDAGDRRAAGSADRRLRDLLHDEGFAVRVRAGHEDRRDCREAGPTSTSRSTSPSANAPKSRSTSRPRSCRPRKRPTTKATLSRDVGTDLLKRPDAPKTEIAVDACSRAGSRRHAWRRPSRWHDVAPSTVAPGDVAGWPRCRRQVSRRPRPGRCRIEADGADGYAAPAPMADQPAPQEENRDRVEEFKTNPVHATARRSGLDLLDRRRHGVLFLRAALAEGRLPAAGRHGPRRGDDQLLPL